MATHRRLTVCLVAWSVLLGVGSVAQAQRIEFGASLANGTFALGEDDDVSSVGIPSGGFGLVNPGVYVSLFLGSHVAVEPQIGFVWASVGDESEHMLNVVGQLDYFIMGADKASPYVFASVGILDSSDDYSPKSVGGGLGYRVPIDGRLSLRLDGRYTHFTSDFGDGGNSVAFTLSVGGIFGGS